MAITPEEYNNDLNKFLAALPNSIRSINEILALSSIPLIKKRLVDNGVTGEGKSLGKYSERPISPGYFIGTGLGSGAEKKVKTYLKQQSKAGLPQLISYKKFRELNDRPTDHVTLSLTEETLNDISITSNVVSNGNVITTIASKNSKSKDVHNKKGKKTGTVGTGDVLDQLGDKYGDILSLTKIEEKDLDEAFDDEIQELINKYL